MVSTTAFNQFTTFWRDTAQTQLTGPKEIINHAGLNTYLWNMMKEANGMDQMIQSGKYIEDRVLFKAPGTFERIGPADSLSYRTVEGGTEWQVPWRIAVGHASWNQWEFSLNPAEMKAAPLGQKYADVRFKKFMMLYTDIANSLEKELYAVPDKTKMEDLLNGSDVYSIPCFTNEFANGLPAAANQPGGAWTTVMGIDPTAADVAGNWSPQRKGYTGDFTTGLRAGSESLLNAFESIRLDLEWEQLPMHAEYSEATSKPTAIVTNKVGVLNLKSAMRAYDNHWSHGTSDLSSSKPTWDGIPIHYISQLNTAALYPTGSGGNLSTWDDDAGTTNAGPRYDFLNFKYMKSVFHGDKYLELNDELITPEGQPFHRVQVGSVTNNNLCRARRYQGTVYPTADITSVVA